jgi:hypothetical protein
MSAFSIIRIYVDPVDRSKLIEWSLSPEFCPVTGDLDFYVEVARAAEDWTRLNASPIQNDNTYTDTNVYNYDLKNNLYYRVVMVREGVSYTSDPYSILSGLSLYEYKVGQMVMKKELERYKEEAAGTEGYLLKRRVWGDACTTCKDYDLDAVVNARCSLCYGTGIIGGYFNGLPYYMAFAPGVTDKTELKDGFGEEDVRPSQARCIAYPVVAPYDMWVNKHTNQRYIIRQVQTVAEIKSVPLIYKAVLMEILPTRPEFTVPISGNEIESDTPDSWRSALTPGY